MCSSSIWSWLDIHQNISQLSQTHRIETVYGGGWVMEEREGGGSKRADDYFSYFSFFSFLHFSFSCIFVFWWRNIEEWAHDGVELKCNSNLDFFLHRSLVFGLGGLGSWFYGKQTDPYLKYDIMPLWALIIWDRDMERWRSPWDIPDDESDNRLIPTHYHVL